MLAACSGSADGASDSDPAGDVTSVSESPTASTTVSTPTTDAPAPADSDDAADAGALDTGEEPGPSDGDTAGPQASDANGEPSALATLQARLAGDTLTGPFGPFCFEGRDSTAAAGTPGSGIAWMDISFDGVVTIFTYEGGAIPSLFTGNTQGETDGTFDMRLRADAGPVTQSSSLEVRLADTELQLGATSLSPVSCTEISEDVDDLFVLLSTSLGELPEGAERLPDAEATSWRFNSTGVVNARSGPGLTYEVVGQWEGTETGVASTGRRARADGFDWIELAATDDLGRSWVAQDFIEEE